MGLLDKILDPVTNKLSSAVSESEFNVSVAVDNETLFKLGIVIVLSGLIIIAANAVVKAYREKK